MEILRRLHTRTRHAIGTEQRNRKEEEEAQRRAGRWCTYKETVIKYDEQPCSTRTDWEWRREEPEDGATSSGESLSFTFRYNSKSWPEIKRKWCFPFYLSIKAIIFSRSFFFVFFNTILWTLERQCGGNGALGEKERERGRERECLSSRMSVLRTDCPAEEIINENAYLFRVEPFYISLAA